MTNYKKAELGKLDDLIKLENGKAFLHDTLELTSCEISLNTVPKALKFLLTINTNKMKKFISF